MTNPKSFVLKSDEKPTEENGLIYKTIAVEGDYQVASSNGQLVKTPMKFIKEGKSDPANNVYALNDIKNSFDQKAWEKVSIPLDHRNRVHENTGWVKDVFLSTDSRGRACLKAALEISDDEVKKKIKNGLIADVSMGIRGNYTRVKDGKLFDVALNHVALTNVPVLQDLDGFEMGANFSDSEGVEAVDVYYFDEEASTVVPTVVEKEPKVIENKEEEEIDNHLMLLYFGRQFGKDINELKLDFNKFNVEGYIKNTALITYKQDNKEVSWAVPFKVDKLEDSDRITILYNKVSFDTINTIEEKTDDQIVEETPKEIIQTREPSTLQERLQVAQEDRIKSLSNFSDQPTGEIQNMTDINFSELDDATAKLVKEALAEKDAVISKFNQDKKAAEIDVKVANLSDNLGLKEYPGLLTYIKDVYLSDDDKPAAIINFSDDESGKPKGLTATEILDGFIERLPKTAEGKIDLSEQHLQVTQGLRPDNDTKVENQLDEDIKEIDAALERAGIQL